MIPVFASIDLLYDKDKTRSLTLRSEVMCQETVNYNTTTTTVKVRRSYQSNVVQFYTKFDFFGGMNF